MKRYAVIAAPVIAALVLAACGQADAPAPAANPELAAPSGEVDAADQFRGANQAAQALGDLSIVVATHLPGAEAAAAAAAPVERLTLSGANGFRLQADLDGAAEPSLLVQGSTLRALMELDVGAAQTLVYRVTSAEGASLCGETPATHVVTFESEDPGAGMKILPLAGGAPGQPNARACARLDYARA